MQLVFLLLSQALQLTLLLLDLALLFRDLPLLLGLEWFPASATGRPSAPRPPRRAHRRSPLQRRDSQRRHR